MTHLRQLGPFLRMDQLFGDDNALNNFGQLENIFHRMRRDAGKRAKRLNTT